MSCHRISVPTLVLAFVLSGGCDRLSEGSSSSNVQAQPVQPVQPQPATSQAAATPVLPFPLPQLPVGNHGGNHGSNGGAQGIQIPGLGTLPIPQDTSIGRQSAAPANLPPPPPGSVDASGAMTPAFLRSEAQAVYAELIAQLPPTERARVAGVPLVVMEDQVEVNALASCSRSSQRPWVGITSALLTLEGAVAEARAHDALSGGNRFEEYVSQVARLVRSRGAVGGLPAGFLAAPLATDPRKLAHQRFLFDEQVAFVLGHELAHHYRGHTGCANGGAAGGAVDRDDIQRVLTHTVPLFHQPLESEADVWGVTNVLDAGAHRAGGVWTEEGAQITLDFFGRLTRMGIETVLLGFLRTHPPPQIRRPIVDNAAQNWRSGRRPSASGSSGLPIPIPIPLPGMN